MKWIPKLLSLIFLWGALALVIFKVEPELLRDVIVPGIYLPFYLLFGFTLWYTITLITKTVLMSLVVTITIVGWLMLSMLGFMHWGLVVVILLTLLMESWIIYSTHEKIHATNEQKNRGTSLQNFVSSFGRRKERSGRGDHTKSTDE